MICKECEKKEREIESLCDKVNRQNMTIADLETSRREKDTIVATESRLAGERWKMYDAERQDHAITKRANADLQKKLEEARGEIKRLKGMLQQTECYHCDGWKEADDEESCSHVGDAVRLRREVREEALKEADHAD